MRKLYIWLLFITGAALFTIFAISFDWKEVFHIVAQSNRWYIAIYLLVSVVILVLHAIRWRVILNTKKIPVALQSTIAYTIIRVAVSFVTPGPKVGGDAMRAALVSRHKVRGKKVRMSKALSTVILDRAVEVQTFAALFFIMVLWFTFFGTMPSAVKYVLVAFSIVLLIIVGILTYSVTSGKSVVIRVLRRFKLSAKFKRELAHFEENVIAFYKTDKDGFALSHCIAALAWFASFIEYKYLLLVLGYNVPLYGVFIVYSFVGLAYMMPVPLALGTLEGSQAAAFALLGLNPAAGIALALITRMRDILFTIAGFITLGYYGIAPRELPKTIRS